jgi:hypothetical protein
MPRHESSRCSSRVCPVLMHRSKPESEEMTAEREQREVKKVTVTKMDAAQRQLETAIGLWFHDADFVSMHTLAMAAREILRALSKKRAGEPMLGDAAAMIRPEFQRQFAEAVLRAANFFKHGTKDPLAAYRFSQDTNDYVLLEACQAFEILNHEETPLMRLLVFYLAFHKPEVFKAEFIRSIQQEPAFAGVGQLSKKRFFGERLPIVTSLPYLTVSAAQDRSQ